MSNAVDNTITIITIGAIVILILAIYGLATNEQAYQEHYRQAKHDVKNMITSNSTTTDKLSYIEYSCKVSVGDVSRCMRELRDEIIYQEEDKT